MVRGIVEIDQKKVVDHVIFYNNYWLMKMILISENSHELKNNKHDVLGAHILINEGKK